MDTATIERIRSLVAPVVVDQGLDLYDVESTGGSLRVLVDRVGGVDLDTIGDVTRAVSSVLDDADPIPGRYTLEVSSPGLERPLRTPQHFAAAVGETVAVKTVAGAEGDRRFEGTLVGADEVAATFDVAGEERTVALEQIERARTVFAWGPAPKPGGGGKKGGGKKQAPGTGATTRKATKR